MIDIFFMGRSAMAGTSTVFKMARAKNFLKSPSIDILETLQKDMLMQIALELELEVKRSTFNNELTKIILLFGCA